MKNKLKKSKFFSVIIATVFSLATLMSFNAFAYDPNGDGYFDAYDLILLRSFLTGNCTVSNLTALDYNQNGVITSTDLQKLSDDLLSGNIDKSVPKGDNTSEPEYISTQTSLHYSVYNAITGSFMQGSEYDIPCGTVYDNGDSTNDVIGDTDERIMDFTKSGVVKIVVSNDTGTHLGTGFIVGPHAIATAAHMIDDNRYRRAASIEHIYSFNSNGTLRTNAITPLEIHKSSLFTSTNKLQEYYDYALITVQEDLSSYPIFELGVYDSMLDKDVTATITGFPGLIKDNSTGEEVRVNNGVDLHTMYSGNGVVLSSNGFKITHSIDTSNGNSGGPLYITERYKDTVKYVAFGIHNLGVEYGGTYNHAVQINSDIIKFYKNNSHIPKSSKGDAVL